jgi:hypothetical protein
MKKQKKCRAKPASKFNYWPLLLVMSFIVGVSAFAFQAGRDKSSEDLHSEFKQI